MRVRSSRHAIESAPRQRQVRLSNVDSRFVGPLRRMVRDRLPQLYSEAEVGQQSSAAQHAEHLSPSNITVRIFALRQQLSFSPAWVVQRTWQDALSMETRM